MGYNWTDKRIQGEKMNKIIKLVFIYMIFVLYMTMLLIYKMLAYLIPGRCDYCIRQRWNWRRKVVIDDHDKPMALCKACKKYEMFGGEMDGSEGSPE